MKKSILSFVFATVVVFGAMAQPAEPANTSSFELGSGLNFGLNEGAYTFKLGGMLQPYMAFEKNDATPADYTFNSKRTYLNFAGTAVKEKVSFFFQMDFSLGSPLLDGWVSYNPFGTFKILAGQKQSISNNREMLVMESNLQFANRSLLSTSLSASGREFGLFIENRFGGEKFAVVPQISITSGDGRNSFGADSRDVDLGGVKFNGRLDIYPFGTFLKGNDQNLADLAHEERPKMVIGAAASYNDGASHAVGEGHGDLFLYNVSGDVQLPDYRKVYADFLFKYRGFSVLGEYAIATATSLDGSYTDQGATGLLVPTQISEYLALGSAYNAQLGYATKSGYAVDLRYSGLMPEFADNANSLIAETTAWSVGFSRYFKRDALKIQTSITQMSRANTAENTLMGQLLFQVVF